MLTIPGTIETLLTQAAVRKNFRVEFPDGEHSDLTNTSILKESVQFTESVCSENVFKFGCTERSTISFTAVGVPNIKGCRIRCSIEIDTSSLTAAQISSIQSGTYDGTLVLAADSDLGYGYYRIPYGVFRVTECPRAHGSAIRREVTAYSPNPWALSPCERTRLESWKSIPKIDYFDVDPQDLIFANLGFWFPSMLDGAGYTKAVYKDFSTLAAAGEAFSKTYTSTGGGHTYTTVITGKILPLIGLPTGLYSVELEDWDTSEAWDHWQSLYTNAPDPEIPQPGTPADNRLPRTYLQPYVGHCFEDDFGPEGSHSPNYYLPDDGCPAFLATKMSSPIPGPSPSYSDDFVELMWDLTVTHSIDGVQQSSETFFPEADVSAMIYSLTPTAFPFKFRLTATEQFDPDPSGGSGIYHYRFLDSYDLGELLFGWLELHAQNLTFGRDGVPRLRRLGASVDVTAAMDQYSDFWYDDTTDVSPISAVRYAYQGADGAEEGIWPAWQTDGSIYDMSGNALLLGLVDVTTEEIYDLVEDLFVPEISLSVPAYGGTRAPEAFPAFELTCHCLPHMEAGDLIRIRTTSGPIGPYIGSYVLEQTIRGIQHLTTTASAAQGEETEGI